MVHTSFNPKSRQYGKRNFIELLELLTPNVYMDEDVSLSGVETDPIATIVNKHITIAKNISSILFISALEGTQYSSINSITGISQFFVKQNNLTNITPKTFEAAILDKLGKSYKNFDTSADWKSYLSGTLLSSIKLNDPQSVVITASSFADTASGTHKYLLDNLGWFYILNTSALSGLSWQPSSFVLDKFTDLYFGKEYSTVDGIKGLQNFVWRNFSAISNFQTLKLVPDNYVSGFTAYTSGLQQLEKLETLIDILYSPLYIDKKDFYVKEAFDAYLSNGAVLTNEVSKGPYRKFLNAIGYSFADLSDKAEQLDLLYNIDEVPPEYLQHIAELIGWKLFGYSEDRWREQLRNAVDIYKMKGTTKAIQSTINSIVKGTILDISGKVTELWESYIPFLAWYALVTDSPFFADMRSWTPQMASKAGIIAYSPSSLIDNVKIVVDSILLDLVRAFPDQFVSKNTIFPLHKFIKLDDFGNENGEYGLINKNFKTKYHVHKPTQASYWLIKKEAAKYKQSKAFLNAHSQGPDGFGVYMAGDSYVPGKPSIYLTIKGDPDFVFNYREHVDYPIPPFEEISFYKNSKVSKDLAVLLEQRLTCFGVSKEFAAQVRTFITDNAVGGTSNLQTLNDFLFFFTSQQTPPNYNAVLGDISRHKYDILSLWNSKSSHLFLDFEQSEIDFTKKTLTNNSKYALYEAARATAAFSPAHAIHKVNFNASAEEYYFSSLSSTMGEYVGLDKTEAFTNYVSSAGFTRSQGSGVNMGVVSPGNNLGRGGLNTFGRAEVNTLFDPLLSSLVQTTAAPRNSFRRRNSKYSLPLTGYYDRTGFNAPNSYDPSVLENSMPSSLGLFPLGYIYSAMKFHPVIDAGNLSGVWEQCENLNSTSVFFGVTTNKTFPYRGLSGLGSDSRDSATSATDKYIDRGQVPPIYIVIHKTKEARARAIAERAISLDPSSYSASSYWRDIITNYANSAIASGEGINSFNDYVNFEFGSDIHKLYKVYTSFFNKHTLRKDIIEDTGANIFSHTYGPTFYNGDMEKVGRYVSSLEGYYVASSLDSIVPIGWGFGSGVFSPCAVANAFAFGTNAVIAPGGQVVPISGINSSGGAEYRNPHILSGIEFVQTSGASIDNTFSLIKLSEQKAKIKSNNYLIDNLVIKAKSANGLPRIRFDMSAAYGLQRNPLVPEHEFELHVTSLVADEKLPFLGGGALGAWIHTVPVNNLMWSFTKEGVWRLHKESELNVSNVVKELSLIYTFEDKKLDAELSEKCLANVVSTSATDNPLSLNNVQKEFFKDVVFKFNTKNFTKLNNYETLGSIQITTNSLFVPTEYYKTVSQQVHTKSQDYVVELFFVPNSSQSTKYLLLDGVSLIDITLNYQAGVPLGWGEETQNVPFRKYIKEEKIKFEKEDLREILRFFNSLQVNPFTSRVGSITSSIMNVSGGGRLNYRIPTDAVDTGINATYGSFTGIDFRN